MIRIVLSWGATPTGLGSHLTGETGLRWTVLELDGASRTITPMSQLSNGAAAAAVPLLRAGAVVKPEVTNANRFTRLPPKK